jgi:acyl phosphate:glycerol-3-phosphate acyltransferase
MMLQLALLAVASYLVGSIPSGLLVSRVMRGVDLRDYGSGKTGMTNALRTLGKGAAVVVLLLDVLKGVAPVLAAKYISPDPWFQVVAALAAILGHDFPIYAGFRGGRGISTSLGATTAMLPPLGPVALIVGLLVLARWRIVSLMSILGTLVAAAAIFALVLAGRIEPPYALYAAVAATLIVVLHHDNIARLRAGTEPKIGEGGHRRPAPVQRARGRP